MSTIHRKEQMNALDELTERRNEAIAGRGEVLTPLERAVVYYESPEAAAELARLQAIEQALSPLVENDFKWHLLDMDDLCEKLAKALKFRT